MKKKKVIVPNIVAGGTAVPLGSNYYLMRGRKHEEGGIDVGANPRTGLEVEDGEIMQLKDKEVRVFSTIPFLNGQSPAQKVMGGENPNKVFAQQEAYKDRNNINDDGTRKNKMGYGGNHPLNTKYKQKQVIDMKNDNSRTKAKAGLRYILQTNGRNKLGYIPSTGESLSEAKGRTKAEWGIGKKTPTYNDYKVKIKKGIGGPNDEFITDTIPYGYYHDSMLDELIQFNYDNEGNSLLGIEGGTIIPRGVSPTHIPDYRLHRRRNPNYIPSKNDSISNNIIESVDSIITKSNDTTTTNSKIEGNYGFPNVTFGSGYVPSISGNNPKGGKLTDWWYPIKKNVNNTKTTPLHVNRTLPNFSLTEMVMPTKVSENIPTEIPNIGVNTDNITMPMTRINVPEFNTSNSSSSTPEVKFIDSKQDTKSFWNRTKNWVEENPNTTSDIASAVSNIGGGLSSYFINRDMLKDLSYDRKPVPRIATKLKTNININPQLDKMRESLVNYERNIDANTASSQVGLARKQKARANSLSGYNELYGYKENAETELINKDRLNQQEVANKSIADYNNYIEKKMAFDNAVREKQADNAVNLVNNLNKTFQGLITTGEKRKADKMNALAIMAANPNVNPRILREIGVTSITEEMVKNWEKINLKKGQ